MDITYYINTGVVEDYVLGLLGEAQRREFESLLPLHPQLREELLAVQILLPANTLDESMPPPISFEDLKYKYTGNDRLPDKPSDYVTADEYRALSLAQRSHQYIDEDKGIVIALLICIVTVVVCLLVLFWVLMR